MFVIWNVAIGLISEGHTENCIPGGQCDSSEGETNKHARAETGVAKRYVDRRKASTIRQVEQKNISTAEWEIILSARQLHHFKQPALCRVGSVCLCVFTLSMS